MPNYGLGEIKEIENEALMANIGDYGAVQKRVRFPSPAPITDFSLALFDCPPQKPRNRGLLLPCRLISARNVLCTLLFT